MSFQLLDQQRAFVEACARPHGAVLALGGPGVGKTTALVEAVAQRVEAGAHMDRLVVLTWSRPAAQRLRAR
ncbi:MAG: AAA family ATPase, partial [Propionibacterium sp.]|nr:AAA family ATPase [Propionibacterium sp.]